VTDRTRAAEVAEVRPLPVSMITSIGADHFGIRFAPGLRETSGTGIFPSIRLVHRLLLETGAAAGYDFSENAGVTAGFFPPRIWWTTSMNDALQVQLNDRQREILLHGLRFVRSRRMMEFRDDDTENSDAERQNELGEIGRLVEILDLKTSRKERTAV
jgi:hypothetical protein